MTEVYKSNGDSGIDYFIDDVKMMTVSMEGGEFGDDPLIEVDDQGRCHVYVIPHDDSEILEVSQLVMYNVSLSQMKFIDAEGEREIKSISHSVYAGGSSVVDYDCPIGAKFRFHIPKYIPTHNLNYGFTHFNTDKDLFDLVPRAKVYLIKKVHKVQPVEVSESDTPVVDVDPIYPSVDKESVVDEATVEVV